MKDVRKLKGLQSQLNTMVADLDVMKSDLKNKQREVNLKSQAVVKLQREIDTMETEGSNTPKVSEHCIVRYFERVLGYDISLIEKEILSEDIVKMVETLGGNGTYPNKKGFSLKMKNNTVTTLIVP